MSIHSTAIISPKAELAKGCEIGPYCVVGEGVVLGEGCWLQHHVSLSGPCVVGKRNQFYSFASIGQRSQDLKYVGEPTHLEIGDDNTFRGFTAVHQFCRVGRFAMTGGCSKIVQDVPPFMIADGNPARIRGINKVGLERHGYTAETLRHLKESYRLLYRSDLNVAQAVEQIRAELPDNPELDHLTEFVTRSGRGIIK